MASTPSSPSLPFSPSSPSHLFPKLSPQLSPPPTFSQRDGPMPDSDMIVLYIEYLGILYVFRYICTYVNLAIQGLQDAGSPSYLSPMWASSEPLFASLPVSSISSLHSLQSLQGSDILNQASVGRSSSVLHPVHLYPYLCMYSMYIYYVWRERKRGERYFIHSLLLRISTRRGLPGQILPQLPSLPCMYTLIMICTQLRPLLSSFPETRDPSKIQYAGTNLPIHGVHLDPDFDPNLDPELDPEYRYSRC